jgi:hypothetical protein
MSYKITYDNTHNYLHAVITGACTKENVAGYLEEVLSKCIEIGTKRVFIDQRLDGPRLETDTVYQIASSISTRAIESRVFEAIAFVDVNAESVLNLKFAESVVANRGLPVKVFFSVNGAEEWLSGLKK